MNRNGHVKAIKDRFQDPDYTLSQAKKDIATLIEAYEELFEYTREVEEDAIYERDRW